jgi:phospholipid/cholesterol/gamma-HCH transport system substrate-binding protein
MEERLLQFRVGVVVILAALIIGILIFLFGEGWTPQYSVTVRAKTAPGVTKNTPVRKNGILIGRVGRVETADRGVVLRLNIKRDEKIYQDEVAQIGTESFLGDAVIDIMPGTSEIRGALLRAGDEMANVRVKPNPMEVVDVVIDLKAKISDAVDSVTRAGNTIDQAGKGISQVTNKIDDALGDENGDIKVILENIRKLSETADSALGNVNNVMKKLDEFVSDETFKGELKETIKGLPEFFDNAKATLADAREAIGKFNEVGAKADTNLANLEDFTKSLGSEGPAIVTQLKTTMEGIDRLVKNVDEFSSSLNSGGGSLGRILKDPELYDNLSATLSNARDVSTRLKPLMNDLRIFADSLARDPGQLGVRGALQKKPAGSGFKGTVFETSEPVWNGN